MSESYQYFTSRDPSPWMFARVLTYHDRAVRTVGYEPPPPTPEQARRRKRSSRINPDIEFEIVGDKVLVRGKYPAPHKCRGAEVLGCGFGPLSAKGYPTVVIRCRCQRTYETTLDAWRWRARSGSDHCSLCRLNWHKKQVGSILDPADKEG